MTDTTTSKRTYTVLKRSPDIMTVGSEKSTAGGQWTSLGEFDASSDKQAIGMAIHDDGGDGGVFVAVARFNPRTVVAKPVEQIKLEWS